MISLLMAPAFSSLAIHNLFWLIKEARISFFPFQGGRHHFTVTAVRHALFQNISRVVVKVGTGLLTNDSRQTDLARMEVLVDQLANQYKKGCEVVLVSSGAVGAGMGVLDFQRRPSSLPELQACAAVGQSRLMAQYDRLFAKHQLHVAQVLLTHADLQHHDRHLNARNTLVALIERGIIPIINENDVVSYTELKFGDNDRLSALVTCLLPADLLVILTTVEGLIADFGTERQHVIPMVEQIDPATEKLARGTKSTTAVGGMNSKIQAAKIVVRSGIPMVIASGLSPSILDQVLAGEEKGTLFVPKPNKLKGRKRWIAFFHHPKGTLVVDDGAKEALRNHGKSLLLPGIRQAEGSFQSGDIVRLVDVQGTEFARGLVRASSSELNSKSPPKPEVVHRNDLVIL